MSWATAGSAIFQQAALNPILGRCWTTAAPPTYGSLSADSIKVALFNNTTAPDKTVSVANSAYAVAQWVTGNEVTSTNWAAGGIALTGKAFAIDTGSSSICFTAANTPGGGTVTLTGFYGCLVYDNTITGAGTAQQGLCFNYFGGSQTVTAGTFCVSPDTEIMTERGWLRYDEVIPGDICLTLNTVTGQAEWQPVTSVHVFHDGPYDVIRMDGPSHSSVTTPGHRWPATTPGADGIEWYTTQTLPSDAQLCISETERTDKVADLTATAETADLVWCVQTPNRTWYARLNGTQYFTGNTILWATPGGALVTAVFNIAV